MGNTEEIQGNYGGNTEVTQATPPLPKKISSFGVTSCVYTWNVVIDTVH